MSKNLFLVQYQDQSYCDDTSETIDQVYLSDELYEKIQKYVKPKEILETKNSTYKISISYVENNDITNIVKNILIPAWIREIEKAIKSDELGAFIGAGLSIPAGFCSW